MEQHRDLKINYDYLLEINDIVKKYIDALEDLQTETEAFVDVINNQEGDVFVELKNEYEDAISVNYADLIDILKDVYHISGMYIEEMQYYIAPENSSMLCRVDRNDIWWNLQQIRGIPYGYLNSYHGVPSHWYSEEWVNPLSDDADEVMARNAENRRRRENNYNRLAGFFNGALKSTADSLWNDTEDLKTIYENYIVEYENTDDVYAGKMDELYDSIKTWIDIAGDLWQGTKDLLRGFGTGIVDFAKGLKAPLEIVLAISPTMPLPLGVRIAFLYDGGMEIYQGTKVFIQDPENTIGAMFQGMFDTGDEEGTAFCVGYATEKVVEAIVAKKVAEKMTGPKVKEKKTFGDYMSPEDAARYDNYWRKTNIGSNETYNEFLKYNPRKDIDDYFKLVKEQSPWPDGYNPDTNKVTLKSGDTFNMVLDSRQKTSSPGGFGIKQEVPSVKFAREDMAIKYGWKDDCGKVATYRVKDGVELTCPSGPIGPQVDLNANKYLPGNSGLTQYDLFNGLGKINRNDYIELVPGSVRRLK